MRLFHLCLAFTALLLSACSTPQEQLSQSPCTIAVPERTIVNKENVFSVRAELQAIGASAAAIPKVQMIGKIESTYQRLGDNDVACALLLRTFACLAQNGRSEQDLSDFRTYVADTKSCQPVQDAVISIDNIVQYVIGDAMRFEQVPLGIDIIVRNSGDKPANLTTAKVWFDEHLRPNRSPANLQKISAIYAVTVDGTGAVVRGAEAQLNSPANAWYPNPGSSVLIVDLPIMQALGPRSTDRFRIQFNFLDSFKSRGPLEQLRVEVSFNDQKAVSSKILKIQPQQKCTVLHVNSNGKMVEKKICNS